MPAVHQLIDFTHCYDASTPPSFSELRQRLLEVIRDGMQWVTSEQAIAGGFVLLLTQAHGCRLTFQYSDKGSASLDVFQPIATQNSPSKFTRQVIENFEKVIQELLGSGTSSHVFPPLKRGFHPIPYYGAVDSPLQEYDITKVVCDVDSEFQNIKVYKTIEFGNVLLLDDEINIAESDQIYAERIIGGGPEEYQGKRVLVLGGGDGGVLREILKHSPKFVTMVEIDRMVIDLSRKHLRGICGDVLDSLTGENYEVKIGDCVPVLEDCIKQGKEMDVIISDLTDIPISTQPIGSAWDFIRLVLELSLKILPSSGRFHTYVKGQTAQKAISFYEQQLRELPIPVEFCSEAVYVPSFCENWMFYTVWKKH